MVYISGTYFQICSICGFKKRNTETRKNWKNQVVCRDTCYEVKHPQLEIKAKADRQSVKDARPEGTDIYIDPDNPITADDL